MSFVVQCPHAMIMEVMYMADFVPKKKMSKKAQKERNKEKRIMWTFSPVTRRIESKKRYDRKKKAHDRYDDDYGMGSFLFIRQDHSGRFRV